MPFTEDEAAAADEDDEPYRAYTREGDDGPAGSVSHGGTLILGLLCGGEHARGRW